jgi:hypothetical protein
MYGGSSHIPEERRQNCRRGTLQACATNSATNLESPHQRGARATLVDALRDLDPRAYQTTSPDDLASLVNPERYGDRSGAFDEIIDAAESHYWTPSDPRYIDFSGAFDVREQLVLPAAFTPELNSAVAGRIEKSRHIEFANEIARFHLSQLLHGEQGGVALAANLCSVFRDPGAQEYAANQVREETRHVRALSRYIATRWGAPAPAGGPITNLMSNLVTAEEVYKKIVGMQIMIEGLALGVFTTMQPATSDPVLARLLRLLITDEAYHHRFGQIWGLATIPTLNEEQHRQVEHWSAGCLLTVAQNVAGAEAKREVYERFGLDWKWVHGAMAEAFGGPKARRELAEANGIFRILVKTLAQVGIITPRTRPLFDMWFDVERLAAEGGEATGDQIVVETTAELRDINRA